MYKCLLGTYYVVSIDVYEIALEVWTSCVQVPTYIGRYMCMCSVIYSMYLYS